MKKATAIVCSLLIFVVISSPFFAQAKANIIEQDTKEVLYRDFLLTILSPYIHQAIDNYYKGHSRSYGLYQTKITDIKRLCHKGQFYFQATVLVETWTGAINPPYGLEIITLSNEANKEEPYVPSIRIVEFKHKDYSPFLPIRINCPPNT